MQVVSKPEDGNKTDIRLPVGTIEARYVDVRDFLGKAIGRGLTAAIVNGQSQQWLAGNGAWRDYRSVNLSLNAAGDSIQVQATDTSSKVFNGTVSVADPDLVSVRGTEGNSRLLRILAHPSEINLTQSTVTTPPSGEGESGAATDAAMSQVSSTLQRVSPATNVIAANQGANNTGSYESVYAQDIEDLMNDNRK